MKNKKNFSFENIGLLTILVALFIVFWSLYHPFIARINIINILLSVALIGIISVPWTMLCISGGLDISVGSAMGFIAVIITLVYNKGVNLVLSIFIGLIIAAIVGLINGLLITKIGINSIITTLGMLSILRGAAFIIAGGQGLPISNEKFRYIGMGRIWIFPIPVVIFIIFFVAGYFVLKYTAYGRNIYVSGGNERAATISGINVVWIRISLYMLTTMGAGLAGLILVSQLGQTWPKTGTGYEFAVITAVVLGGVSLAGGKGRISGALLGVLIIGTLSYGLEITGVHSFYITIAQGTILLIAVMVDQLRLRRIVT
ncbi:MAG: ABC transporter permease [Actinobacteria bacterium]|nr:ABC transporter permease [Actinomycetota bacterium]